MNQYVLVQQLLDPNKTPIKIFLNKDEVYVGRAPMPRLKEFQQVSRNHARFFKTDSNAIFVSDLDSANGLFVNGIRIGKRLHALHVGDVIGFGIPFLDSLRDGFLCELKQELLVKPEVYDVTDDESEDETSSSATNSYNAKDISMKLVSNVSVAPLPEVKISENNVEPVKALNGNKAFKNLGISKIQSIASCSSLLNASDHPEHNAKVQSNVPNSSALNKVKTQKFAEICRKQTFFPNLSSSDIGDITKHTADVNCDDSAFSELNRNKTSYESPKVISFSLNHSSSDKRENSGHSTNIEHGMGNKSALIKGNTSDYPGISVIKGPSQSFLSSKGDSSFQSVQFDRNASKSSVKTSENARNESIFDRFKLKTCQVVLKRCDSKSFEVADRDKIFFKKQNVQTKGNEKNILSTKKKKRMRILSNSSDDSDEGSSLEKKSKNADHESDYEEEPNEFCYSQIEEIILVSDDESYLDSQNYAPIKEEPLDVQEDIDNFNEDAILREIFDDPEIISPVLNVGQCDNNEESIEAIQEHVGVFNNNNIAKEIVKNDTPILCGDLLMQCSESEGENDSEMENTDSESEDRNSDQETQLQILKSENIPLGDSIVKNSSEANTVGDEIRNSFSSIPNKAITVNKSIGRTLLTEPKPLQQRPRKMRGREEGFKEQKIFQQPSISRSPKQSQKAKRSIISSPKKTQKRTVAAIKIQIGNANPSLSKFRIPRKVQSKNEDDENHPSLNLSKVNNSKTRQGVSEAKRTASVKKRPENYGSRSGFLTEELEQKTFKKGKQTANEPKSIAVKEISSGSAECTFSKAHIQLNDKSSNNVSKTFNKIPVHLNQKRDKVEHSRRINKLDSDVSDSRTVLSIPVRRPIAGIVQDAHKHPRWDAPSASSATPYKNAPVSGDQSIMKQTRWDQSKHERQTNTRSKDSRQNHIPINHISHTKHSSIPNNVAVSLNPRDPRQAKFITPQNVGQTEENQTSNISLNLATTSALIKSAGKTEENPTSNISSNLPTTSASIKKTEGFKRPTSSSRASMYKDFKTSTIIFAKKLVNLKTIWLPEQAKFDQPPAQVREGASNLPLHFLSYDSYASFFEPMMMLEVWDYMFTESKEVFKCQNKAVNKFYFSLLSYEDKSDCIELKCESIVADKVSYCPREGSMVILDLKDGSGKEIHPHFGYIFKHSVDKLNMDKLKNPEWKNLPKEWLTNAKHWIFHAFVKKKLISFLLSSLMKGNGICYIRSKLRLADALGQLKNSPLLPSIIKPDLETFRVNYTAIPATREYTSSQMTVIYGIFSAVVESKTQPKIILLQGPPGTGKTHTIIGLLEKLINDCKKFMRILVVAPSNAAVDEIGCRLIDLNEQNQWRDRNIKFVRVGSEKQIHKKILPYYLDTKCRELFNHNLKAEAKRKHKDIEDLQSEIARNAKRSPGYNTNEKSKYLKDKLNHLMKKHIIKEMDYHTERSIKERILEESHIVLSTLNSCGLSILNKTFRSHTKIQFSCCIMDESTQCTELEVLQPVMFGIDKLILVGDHEQLPATVTSKLAREFGFERSMFERLHLFFERYFHRSPVMTLTEQFRMHSQICEFPSKHFYKGQLITYPRTDVRYSDCPINPYLVLDIAESQESNDSSSKMNTLEASVIVDICRSLLDLNDSPSSIGIITFYQGQRLLYEKALQHNPNYRAIEINTVDGFQGREKEIIIMSCVRANSQSGGIGFLACKNRLNVAITRAKKCLIICCHANSLKANHDWRSLIDDAKNRNVLINVSSNKDIPYVFANYIMKKE